MKKLGIYLINFYFVIGSIKALLDILTEQTSPSGLFGFRVISYYENGEPVPGFDILTLATLLLVLWINVCIAYNLILMKNQGRVWALWFFGLSIISLTARMVFWFVKYSINLVAHFDFLDQSFTVPLYIYLGFYWFLYAASIYFLTRPDVKMEFQPQKVIEVKPVSSEQ